MNAEQKALATEVVDAIAAGYLVPENQMALAETELAPVAPKAVLKVIRMARTRKPDYPGGVEIKKARAALAAL